MITRYNACSTLEVFSTLEGYPEYIKEMSGVIGGLSWLFVRGYLEYIGGYLIEYIVQSNEYIVQNNALWFLPIHQATP